MICPNDRTHLTRLEPGRAGGLQIYCTLCAEFFDPCTTMLGPMTSCELAKGHGNVHEDRHGNIYVLNLKGVTKLFVSTEDCS